MEKQSKQAITKRKSWSFVIVSVHERRIGCPDRKRNEIVNRRNEMNGFPMMKYYML
jgi:hypothetical protein